MFLEVGEQTRESWIAKYKGLQHFLGSEFSTVFFFLLAFSLHPLLLRCAAIDFWMIYVLFFIVASPSVAPVCARNLI